MYYEIQTSIRGGLEPINETVSKIIGDTRDIINDEDVFFDLRLILNELLINGFEHGNKCDCEKAVNLDLKINTKDIEIVVEDEGEGFCYQKEMIDSLDLATDGRGLILVMSLSDCLEIRDNIIRCVINRS